MSKECKNCVHKSDFKSAECGVCRVSYYDGVQIGLPSNFEQKPQTNADRIRAMSDEELAKILNAFTAYFEECNRSLSDTDCHDCELCELCSLGEGKAIEWLKQPADMRGEEE